LAALPTFAKVNLPDPPPDVKPQGVVETGGAQAEAPLDVAVFGEPHSKNPVTKLNVAPFAFAGSTWLAQTAAGSTTSPITTAASVFIEASS